MFSFTVLWQVDVARLEEQTYHFRIFCPRGPGVLVQLVQAVESLGVQVINSHHTAFQENILNSFIAEVHKFFHSLHRFRKRNVWCAQLRFSDQILYPFVLL